MKKLLALILALLLAVSAAGAELADAEPLAPAEAYRAGAEALLNSIDLQRDMLTMNLTQGEQAYQMRIAQADGTTALALSQDGVSVLEAQMLQDQIYLALGDTVLNLKYEDLMSVMNSGVGSVDPQALGVLALSLATTVILPHLTTEAENGLHVVFAATGKELYTDLATWLDEVLADETYYPMIDSLLGMLKNASGTEIPTAAELAEAWPQLKENLLAQDPDFHVNFELTADSALTQADITGEIGSTEDLYLMEWAWRASGETKTLNGELTQRITRDGESRDYCITVDAEMRGRLWTLNISYPTQAMTLEAEGSSTEEASSFRLSYTNLRQRAAFRMEGSCAKTENGFSAQLTVTDSMKGAAYFISMLAGEDLVDLSVTDNAGQKLFALKALKNGEKLIYAEMETKLTGGGQLSAVYDGEKVILTADGASYLITWNYETDHDLVVTVHPERGEGDAVARFSYEGEEGNFSFTGSATGPDGSELMSWQLLCEPTSGIGEALSERENIIYLTPEMIMSLLQQMR